MFDIVLYQPEIPPNAGNVIRLAANTGSRLHFVEPLGFSMDDKQLKRAGLDYHALAHLTVHRSWSACRSLLGPRIFVLTSKTERRYADVRFQEHDAFVFGSETGGLPEQFIEEFPEEMRLRLPMHPGNRSLNLSNAVAVVVFEAWRQTGYRGAG